MAIIPLYYGNVNILVKKNGNFIKFPKYTIIYIFDDMCGIYIKNHAHTRS